MSMVHCFSLTTCLAFGLSANAQTQAAPQQSQSPALEQKLREARYDLHFDSGHFTGAAARSYKSHSRGASDGDNAFNLHRGSSIREGS